MDSQAEFPFVSGQLTRLLTDIGVAAKIVNHQVNRAGLAGILGQSGSQNTHNEDQQKLDVFADKTFMRILVNQKVVMFNFIIMKKQIKFVQQNTLIFVLK